MTPRPAILHEDGKYRCPWPGTDPLYVAYHDTDWGVPEFDSRALFEKFILDGFQAGLSWITILRKRETFRAAFDGFQPHLIADYDAAKVEELMNNPGIIRNRAKIVGTIESARIWMEIEQKQGFTELLWKHYDGRPQQNNYRHHNDVPTQTEISERVSKELKKLGFKFCGPTIVYAFMEAVGMVNDHLTDCFRHEEVRAIGKRL